MTQLARLQKFNHFVCAGPGKGSLHFPVPHVLIQHTHIMGNDAVEAPSNNV